MPFAIREGPISRAAFGKSARLAMTVSAFGVTETEREDLFKSDIACDITFSTHIMPRGTVLTWRV
jgi:hypothetical protein